MLYVHFSPYRIVHVDLGYNCWCCGIIPIFKGTHTLLISLPSHNCYFYPAYLYDLGCGCICFDRYMHIRFPFILLSDSKSYNTNSGTGKYPTVCVYNRPYFETRRQTISTRSVAHECFRGIILFLELASQNAGRECYVDSKRDSVDGY
jgi:hypothetical protein